MILVDTSVWVDYLRRGDNRMVRLLNDTQVLMHLFVLGELACGNLHEREQVLALLRNLPKSIIAGDEEVLFFIERHKLMGRGIGYVDAHLLAAAKLTSATRLWTRDRRLREVAESLALAATTEDLGA